MPFVKGGKAGPGKPKGAKNKKTIEWEILGSYMSEQGVKRYMEILKHLPDDEFMDRFEGVLEYFKPRLARTDMTSKNLISIYPSITEEKKAEISAALADF